MWRIIIVALAIILPLQGVAYGQGFLESILGGGWVDWGSEHGNPMLQQYNSPQFYGSGQYNSLDGPYSGYQGYQGYQGYEAQPVPQPGAYPQQPYPYAPGQYGQPGPPPNWQQYQQPPVQQPPPVSYSAPPQNVPPQPLQPGPQGAPLRPGQYSPGQPPINEPDELPPGATSITTITPEGTTYQYYPPAGQPPPQPQVTPPPARPVKPRAPAPARPQARVRPAAPSQQQAPAEQAPGTGIVAPAPMDIPPGQDPRLGWSRGKKR